MSPRILEYEDRIVKVTPQAYALPELKEVLDKYKHPEACLTYIHAMSALDSPYINIPEVERGPAAAYDIQLTMSQYEFDPSDPILENAIRRMKALNTSVIIGLAEQLADELNNFTIYLKNTPLTEENMEKRQQILKDVGKYATEYTKVRKMADEEIKANTKGGHEIGSY